MKKRLLVIGGTGFVGMHIRDLLCSNYDVDAYGRELDIRDAARLKDLFAQEKPDHVIHLAAVTTVAESFQNPCETYDINFWGTHNVLLALRECGFRGRLLYVGSSHVYGSSAEHEMPVSEDRPLKPLSPYAVSKVAAEALCYQWSQTEEFEIIMARPFNHIGPGQNERFAVSSFAKQIIEIKLRRRPPVLNVGQLDVTRDFTDVRDVVHAYALLLDRGRNGEIYNVCSGVETSMRAVVAVLLETTGVIAVIQQDATRLRASEQHRIYGSHRKLRNDTGWEPQRSLNDTLKDILTYWENALS